MRPLACWLAVGLLLSAPVGAEGPPENGPPTWALEEIESTEGRWLADNSRYKSADEPYDVYGLEWHSAAGKRSLRGRLFAIQGTTEMGTLWEYRLFWHPERRSLWVFQFGTDGTFGEGELERTEPGSTELIQTFYAPGGATWRSGHRETKDASRRTTESFAIDSEGNWKPQRVYTWIKQGEEQRDE